MSTQKFYPPKDYQEKAYVKSPEEFETMYEESLRDPDGFWARMAEENITWSRKWDEVMHYDFLKPEVRWFEGAKLNVSFNCLDRHLDGPKRDKTAIIWEPEEGKEKKYTYGQLHEEVCRFANVLKKFGVRKGDRVAFYLPMVPELAIGMLACTRIGAVHSVVFGGFSSISLRDRINDCEAKVLVTADAAFRSGKKIPLKKNADEALEETPTIERCLVVRRAGGEAEMEGGRDVFLDEELREEDISTECEPEEMDAEDPLFILYTSGSTGKPKGLLHTTGGYVVFAAATFKYVFDYHEEDVFWCTADIGWITGHSYIVYGPLAQGATSLMFEGVPTYPAPDRYWQVVEKYGVNTLYTAPTVVRALMREGDEWPEKRDLSSLRLLGSVGEPINPEAWLWYHKHVGRERCPVVDTWWQTETGGILISSLPGAMPMKPGAAGRPFFGVDPKVVRMDGSEADVGEDGILLIKNAWPAIARTIHGNPERYLETYFSQYKGHYFTGDGAMKDAEGDYHLRGRIDDVINVSGHRLGTAEIESAVVEHHGVAEAAVVGFPHEVKGEGIYVYVILKSGVAENEGIKKEIVDLVRKDIGPIARPDYIQFVDGLPKTRSGKIMRRILRKVAAGRPEEIGDVSTLADPSVVEELKKGMRKG